MRTLRLLSCLLLVLCGCGSSAPAPSRAPAKTPPPVAREPEPEEPRPTTSSVQTRGLTGTLNTDDVHQTMDARKQALDECIVQSRRRLRLVSGTIRYSFKVDAEGAVEDVHAIQSDIGHRELESCILGVLVETRFPAPAGNASARFDWGLSVEPAYARAPEPLEPSFLDKVLRKHASEIYKRCEVRRKRARFQVTMYISRTGRVVSAGAIPRRAQHEEKVDCVLQELASLRVPKPKRDSKLTFELR